MYYLLLGITCSVCNLIFFKYLGKKGIGLAVAVPFSYLVSVMTGAVFFNGATPEGMAGFSSWALPAVCHGILLISGFSLLALTVRHIGVVEGALASRLAVIMPVVWAVTVYGEGTGADKFSGVGLAIAALYLITAGSSLKRSCPSGVRPHSSRLLLPAGLFLASGAHMIYLKWVQAHFLTDGAFHGYILTAFAAALLTGLAALALRSDLRPDRIRPLDFTGGAALGLVNYGAVMFPLPVLAQPGWEASVVFPTISVSVVAVGTVLGRVLFREALPVAKIMGIILGAGAILLLN
ncbi:MAG: hypothetical protein CSB33_02850 [Desulfobacterales bacterium]|nr:MAG: hypothetical protein CSB33_02850 [Desulfobacterales bacterium]